MAKKKRTTWKELKSIAERNAIKIEKVPDEFISNEVKEYQDEVLKEIEFLIMQMENENGFIKKNKHNLMLMNKLDATLTALKMTSGVAVINSLSKRISGVLKDNFDYYGNFITKNDQFKELKKSIEEEVNSRFGIKNGKLIVGGFVYALLNDESVKTTIKESLYTSIYANGKVSDAIFETKAYLNGKKGRRGAIEDFYSKYTSEVFNHADRMASRAFAKKYNLKWFVYAGTIVKNSRAFCRAKIGGIYNIEEAKGWINEIPSPLGISKESYSPTIHMGGINCRHSPFFITEQMKEEFQEMMNKK